MSIYSVSPVSTLLHCSETSFMLVVIFGKNHSIPRVSASLATQCSLITVFSIIKSLGIYFNLCLSRKPIGKIIQYHQDLLYCVVNIYKPVYFSFKYAHMSSNL